MYVSDTLIDQIPLGWYFSFFQIFNLKLMSFCSFTAMDLFFQSLTVHMFKMHVLF